ncbi:hypothetical protein GGR58DRAFT_503767 [Xylaria digitata]|nr:hypothetical protein GGR58DRAFT_503767 [Xylaria digitata]
MAENSGRGNIIDAADAPKGGDVVPPPVPTDLKDAVGNEARKATAGVHESGQERGMRPDATVKVKTGGRCV